jgi:hypothetical protein
MRSEERLGRIDLGQLSRRVFVEFVMQFIYFYAGVIEGAPARRRDRIDSSAASIYVPELRLQEASALHAVEERVEGSGTDTIAVMVEFVHHGEAEDGLVNRVHEHVNPDEAGEQIAWTSWLCHWYFSGFNNYLNIEFR